MVLLVVGTFSIFAQSIIVKGDTMAVEEVLKENYQVYLGKKVQDLLGFKYIRDYEDYTFFDNKPGSLSGVLLKISDGFFIEISVDEYKYVKQFNVDRNWDFSLFKKEEISCIRFILNEETLLEVK